MVRHYKKRPLTVEAVQWDGVNLSTIKQFCSVIVSEIHDAAWRAGVAAPVVRLTIPTQYGELEVDVNDYIIKGVEGEFYPCKPDIFNKLYEDADA